MKTMTSLITVSAFLSSLILQAQEPPRPPGGGLAERFKRLDRDGDGFITTDELPPLENEK